MWQSEGLVTIFCSPSTTLKTTREESQIFIQHFFKIVLHWCLGPICHNVGTPLKHNKYIFYIPLPFCHNLYPSATLKQFLTELAGFVIIFHVAYMPELCNSYMRFDRSIRPIRSHVRPLHVKNMENDYETLWWQWVFFTRLTDILEAKIFWCSFMHQYITYALYFGINVSLTMLHPPSWGSNSAVSRGLQSLRQSWIKFLHFFGGGGIGSVRAPKSWHYNQLDDYGHYQAETETYISITYRVTKRGRVNSRHVEMRWAGYKLIVPNMHNRNIYVGLGISNNDYQRQRSVCIKKFVSFVTKFFF